MGTFIAVSLFHIPIIYILLIMIVAWIAEYIFGYEIKAIDTSKVLEEYNKEKLNNKFKD